MVCNTTGSATTFDIYHDDDGSTYDQTTALFYGVSIEANTTVEVVADAEGSGIPMARTANLGVKPGADQALTFSIYGITEAVA